MLRAASQAACAPLALLLLTLAACGGDDGSESTDAGPGDPGKEPAADVAGNDNAPEAGDEGLGDGVATDVPEPVRTGSLEVDEHTRLVVGEDGG